MPPRKRLPGRGPTPPAEKRPGHPAARRAAKKSTGGRAGSSGRGNAAASRATGTGRAGAGPATPGARAGGAARGTPRPGQEAVETILGRNPVVEALRERVPARTLLVVDRLERDPRVVEAINLASRRGIGVQEVTKADLDRLGVAHQGLALQIPPYRYAHLRDLLDRVAESGEPGLVVALDGVTDARNLGAIVRSTAALGGHGVLVPERRSAGMTAGAWKASAGAAARLPVARATNLPRALREGADAGLLVVGLAADGEVDIDDFEAAEDALLLVIGSEGKGLSRLVREVCDLTLRIPLTGSVESLNAGVAAGVALAEIARRRRLARGVTRDAWPR